MKLKYLASVIPAQDGEAKISTIVCSPNGNRTAIACADRSIALLDENGQQKDRFSCKPIDSKYGKKSFTVLCMTFSPDSSRIAIGQSDNVLFIYKIGTSWNEKKVIVNKFVQPSAVTCLSWPFDDKILVGQLDGKVRIGLIKTNKCSSLFKTEETVVALQTHPKRTSFVSAHQDGSIILYNFASRTQSKICTLQAPPYNLVFTNNGLVVATADRRVLSYTENGVVQQQFDYNDQVEKEFSSISVDPTAQNVVVASFDRIRLFSWSARRGAWDEGAPLEIQNAYTIGALGWKMDGSTIYAGTVCGAVFSVDCCLRRGMLKSRFETTYVAPSHVILRDVTNDSRTNVISNRGLAIDELKIVGKDRFVIGYTSSSIVIADTESQRFSELEWQSGGHEKFYFDFNNCCLIINAGEVTVVEYGVDGALGWVRTELTSPHLLSVQISGPEVEEHKRVKKLAYLVDPTTISIINLVTGQQESFINHPGAIDWIELNESASKLLYRDKRSKVTLVDITTDQRNVLLSFCTYVQWVPMSDVIVAQSGDNLSVWYNPDLPEQVTNMKIKGEVEAVFRDADRTEVIVQEPTAKIAYELDNTQIEFGAALEKRDFDRAVAFLESNTGGADSYSMWTRVAEMSLEHGNLFVAQRCYAAIGDVAKVRKLHDILEIADEAAITIGGDGTHFYKCRAMIAIMQRKFKEAERIFLEQNDTESAIGMYTSLHKWDEALELAKVINYPNYEQLKSSYLRALNDTGQTSKAAELKATDGDTLAAIQLFINANKPLSALNAATNDSILSQDEGVMRQIADSLIKSQLYDRAGDVYEKLRDFDKAVEYYKKGDSFGKAIQLARFAFPEKVVSLEQEWGLHLEYIGQYDAAVNHFVEANDLKKAVECAIRAKEWPKALSIVENIQDQKVRTGFYGEIADHYSSKGEFERAERLFVEAGLFNDAIIMYTKNSKWIDAYRLSEEFHGREVTISSYLAKAEDLDEHGRFAEAEQLYITIGMPHKAIQMYDRVGRDEDVLRLETRKRFATQYEERGDLRAAEEEFLKAGDFRAAINMYRENEMWSDAYRIAKTEGGENMEKQVLFMWAKSIGGDAAVKLLNKHGMLLEGIDFACETGAFDLAFDLSRIGAKEQMPLVHTRLASQLEEEGRLEDASKHYVEGNKPDLAVDMFIRDGDWAAAEKIASEHCTHRLPDVYTGQARRAIEEGDNMRAETFLLRANKPDIILKYFVENEMWPDALRIAQNYLPHQAALIQEQFEKAELRSGARGVDSYVAQAKEWELNGEWRKAVQALLRINRQSTDNMELIKQSTEKAADLVMKFLMGDEEYIGTVLGALDDADCNEKAAELLLQFGQTRQAINALCRARQWGKAKQVAEEYLPDMVAEIEKMYKESLKSEGRLGELIDVDVVTAIDMMIENDQWDKALDTAKSQNYRPLLDKYVAQYAALLVHRNDLARVLTILERYGASGNPANFSIYKHLMEETLAKPKFEYSEVARVRNVYLDALNALKNEGSAHVEEFTKSLWALHLISMRSALEELDMSIPEVQKLCLKQSLSLLRYTDVLVPDRIFYEAGAAAKEIGNEYESLGFLLLNHYLDLVDAIEEGNGELVDYSPFENSDIPTEVSLPTRQWLESAKHEEIKEWVLAASVDDTHAKELVYDRRGVFEASLTDRRGNTSEPCLVTGYPVIESTVRIGSMVAEKDNLNKFVSSSIFDHLSIVTVIRTTHFRFLVVIKSHQTENLLNVQNFVARWAGSPLAISL
uniref:WD_REPEATS_REGION domain-containing protein n=1 Tax=Caenorhabditis tropicalis TaxID=1561998 RepID=A0A1I7TZF2_9PELO